MNKEKYKTNCFGYCITRSGGIKCSALLKIDCQNCKFFKSRSDYIKNVLPLQYKEVRGCIT